jgi:hypothetical protein
LKRDTIAHLGTLDFIAAKDDVVFLGLPGTGKTHQATGLGIRACRAGHRVAFATAAEWVAQLGEAHQQGACTTSSPAWGEFAAHHRRGRPHPLRRRGGQLVLPTGLGPPGRACVIVTSNKPFGRWGEVFGDLRQYFPKGTNLNVHSSDDLVRAAAELNGRPRKTLAGKLPAANLSTDVAQRNRPLLQQSLETASSLWGHFRTHSVGH